MTCVGCADVVYPPSIFGLCFNCWVWLHDHYDDWPTLPDGYYEWSADVQ